MAGSIHLTLTQEHLGESKQRRLDALLAEFSPESRSFLRQQINNGRVRLNGKVVTKPNQSVRVGDTIEGEWVVPPPNPEVHAIPADLHIVFEDTDLLVLNKPQGMVVHPAPSHQGATLVHHLLHHMEGEEEFSEADNDRPGIVHRLDKGTSGLLLVAKNRATQETLSAQFKNRVIKKTYEALTWGKLPGHGRFESEIGRDRANRRKMSSRTQKGRQAITDWKALRVFRHFTHVSLSPFTGRTHQLRVHLSENGNPIVGDPLYGNGLTETRRRELGSVWAARVQALQATFLHARRLQFDHPVTGIPQSFEAPRPEIFETFLRDLEESENET
jgi:23S rRNA pseudouridine1911/1915/1917 synthase